VLLMLTNAISQKSKITEKEELIKFKTELFKTTTPEMFDNNYNFNATSKKSFQDEYGSSPGWDKITTYGGSGKDFVRETAIATDGSFYVIGSFSGEMSIEETSYECVGKRDAFLAKFQSNGSLIWLLQFSPEQGGIIDAFDICINESENLCFTGYYTGEITLGDFTLPGTSPKNMFVAISNSDGEIIMATTSSLSYPEAIGLKVDTDQKGNIYVMGSNGLTDGWYASYLVKLSKEGSVLQSYYHSQSFVDFEVINNQIYLTGTFYDAAYFDDFYLDPMGYNDAFLTKMDTSFVFSWAELGNHPSEFLGRSKAISMYVSDNEDIYLLGSVRNNVYWGDIELDADGGFITKCSSDGLFLWASEILDYVSDNPLDLTVKNDKVFVSTYFYSWINPIAINQIVTFLTSNGQMWNYTSTNYKTENINHCSTDNSLVISQDVDQLIQLSKLDGNTLNSDWTYLFGGNSASAYSVGADVDQYGCFYNYGYTANKIDYYGKTIEKGLFLAKHDVVGEVVWVVQFNDADYLENYVGNLIVVDTISNSIYLTGDFKNPMVIPGGPTLITDDYGSLFLLKYDFNGNYQWVVQEDLYNSNPSLANDYSGNVILIGNLNGPVTIGDVELLPWSAPDVFVIKYSGLGEVIWAKSAVGDDIEFSAIVACDKMDNVYFAGEFISNDIMVDDYPLTLEDGDGNVLVAKFNSDGDIQWVTSKAGTTDWELGDYYGWPTDIHTDPNGYTYLKGWHYDYAHFDDIVLISSIEKPNYNNRYNKFVAKLDPEGKTIWAKTISEHLFSRDHNQFDVDQNGNVYCGLMIRDTTIFEGKYTYINSGVYDFTIAKYTIDGDLDWVKSVKETGNGSSFLNSIACLNQESIFVSGWFSDQMEFDGVTYSVTNKNGFIGLLGESLSRIEYKQKNKKSFFDLFPNPAYREVTILFKNTLVVDASFEILDMSGKKVYTAMIDNKYVKSTISLAKLSPGVYFVKIKSGDKTGVEKLLIK